MRVLKIIVIIAMCGTVLCSCSKNDTDSQYVDINSQDETESQPWVDISTENSDFTYDDKPDNIMRSAYTVDSDYVYLFDFPNRKISLESGEVQNICEITGCAHTEETQGCIDYQNFISPVATKNGIYYVDGANLMLLSGGGQEVLATNDYYTDYEKEAYPNEETFLGSLTIHNNLIYIICPTYIRTYDLSTKELSEPKILDNSLIMAFSVNDDYAYFSDDALQFFRYNLKTDEITKLEDKVGQTAIYGDKVYYVKWEDEVPVLYSRDIDGENPTKLIEDCYVNYIISGDYIYYQTFSADVKKTYAANLTDMSSTEIAFDDEDVDEVPVFNIFSTGGSSSVFMENGGKLFIFEVGSTEYTYIEWEAY